jgi:3-polyprenyl-4-hydroxybenzoate decarboxylase
MLRVYPSTRRPGAKAANLCMVKKTELLVTQESDHAIVAFLKKKATDNFTGWEITMAPGVDPALVICTAAVVEDTTSTFA